MSVLSSLQLGRDSCLCTVWLFSEPSPPPLIKGQRIGLRKTGTHLRLWRMRCGMREIVGDRGWGRRISSPHSMSECLEMEHKFIIRWLKSLGTSKWLHGCATPLIWSAFSLDIYARAAKRTAAKSRATDAAAAGRESWCKIISLVTAENKALWAAHKKQHGFHPDEEISPIIKSMCLFLGT